MFLVGFWDLQNSWQNLVHILTSHIGFANVRILVVKETYSSDNGISFQSLPDIRDGMTCVLGSEDTWPGYPLMTLKSDDRK